jgi:hypothetical protein
VANIYVERPKRRGDGRKAAVKCVSPDVASTFCQAVRRTTMVCSADHLVSDFTCRKANSSTLANNYSVTYLYPNPHVEPPLRHPAAPGEPLHKGKHPHRRLRRHITHQTVRRKRTPCPAADARAARREKRKDQAKQNASILARGSRALRALRAHRISVFSMHTACRSGPCSREPNATVAKRLGQMAVDTRHNCGSGVPSLGRCMHAGTAVPLRWKMLGKRHAEGPTGLYYCWDDIVDVQVQVQVRSTYRYDGMR